MANHSRSAALGTLLPFRKWRFGNIDRRDPRVPTVCQVFLKFSQKKWKFAIFSQQFASKNYSKRLSDRTSFKCFWSFGYTESNSREFNCFTSQFFFSVYTELRIHAYFYRHRRFSRIKKWLVDSIKGKLKLKLKFLWLQCTSEWNVHWRQWTLSATHCWNRTVTI